MKRRANPRAVAAGLIVVASVNLMNIVSSPRWQQIRAVDALRLFAAGMLFGVAVTLLFRRRAAA